MSHLFLKPAQLALAGMVLVALSGCGAVQTSPDVMTNLPPGTASYSVEVHQIGEEAKARQFPLTKPVFVQDVLQETGVMRSFKRMNVTLVRRNGKPQPLRLDVPFRRASRTVEDTKNYAIRDGDKLVVEEDSSNVFDDMMQPLKENLGVLSRF